MKMSEYWNVYIELTNKLVLALPEGFQLFGIFVLKWSPLIMLLILVATLIDMLLNKASVKFIANLFVKLLKFLWQEAFTEPKHKGLIIQAPIKVQKIFHQFCAWSQGALGVFMLLFTFLSMYLLITLSIKPELLIEGFIVFFLLSAFSLYLALIQFGFMRQSMKLINTSYKMDASKRRGAT